jgi:hypothetical protein
MTQQRRRIYSPTVYERKILKILFLFATAPVALIIALFFALFSDLIYTYIQSDLGGDFLDRFLFLVILILIYYAVWTRLVFRFANRLAGAYQRLLNELDKIIDGAPPSPLHLRKGDYAQELINRINQLIDKFSK